MNQKEAQERKFQMMTNEKVEKLIAKMALPSIVSMLVSSIYNMVDTMFVGRISTQATAGVGVVFSFMAIVQALGFFFGHGSGQYISRALGRKDRENASALAATGFFSCFFSSLVLMAFGFLFMDPLLRFLGATETILPEARRYLFFILMGAPFISCSFIMNLQMRLQGNARTAMYGIAAGAILNCALDPILIFGCGLGVMGASLATALSQLVSFLLLLWLSGKNGGIKIRFSEFKPKWWHYSEIVAGGLPSLSRQCLASVATICLNRVAGGYGDASVAAFSIVNRYVMFTGSVLLGYGQGFQPVCGFNFGARKFGRVRKAFWHTVVVGTIYCTITAILSHVYAPEIITFFRKGDPEVVKYGSTILHYQSYALPLMAFNVISNMYLQTIKRPVMATITAMARQGIIFLPVLFILNALFGLPGAMVAQTCSDVLTLCITIPMALYALSWMMKMDEKEGRKEV